MLLGQLLDHGGVQPGSPYYFGNRSHTFIALRLHFLKILLLLSYYFTSKTHVNSLYNVNKELN